MQKAQLVSLSPGAQEWDHFFLEVFEGFTLAVAFIIGLGQLEMALDLPLGGVTPRTGDMGTFGNVADGMPKQHQSWVQTGTNLVFLDVSSFVY